MSASFLMSNILITLLLAFFSTGIEKVFARLVLTFWIISLLSVMELFRFQFKRSFLDLFKIIFPRICILLRLVLLFLRNEVILMVKSENTTVCVTVSKDLLEKIDLLCLALGIRRSFLINQAVSEFIFQHYGFVERF